ncbi:MAG: hypothetical protein AMJ79_13610 [Phycisphaerae bacterium SM23_30]|nr:MAG: hypothetical protein AMJ79_13610 [Phycisphaerae bacterium SM23_30]
MAPEKIKWFNSRLKWKALSKERREWRGGQVFLGLLVVGLGVVLGRCWQLQYTEAVEHQERVKHQQLKIIPQSARRGSIVDRQGRYLAMSTRADSVRVDPYLLKDFQDTAGKLAGALGLDEEELYGKLQERRDKRFMWVKRFINPAEAEKVRELEIRGVVLEREYQRQYPMGQLAAHVIGYTTIDGDGLEGVEAGYDEYLRGQAGQWHLSSDALRRPIGSQEEFQPAKDGSIVVLSIDSVIQSCVEEQLESTVEKFRASGATGIVMDPVTGEVWAMANWPTFDPKTARQSPAELKRNRALTDKYEPGSTFKPFTLAAALEGGHVAVGETIFCHNGNYAGKGFGKIGEYGNHGWGNLTAGEIIVYSSNIGAAKIAQKIGKKNFFQMVEKFGFGRRTGIDLAGEVAGTVRPLSQWDRGQYDLTRAAFGQGPIVERDTFP